MNKYNEWVDAQNAEWERQQQQLPDARRAAAAWKKAAKDWKGLARLYWQRINELEEQNAQLTTQLELNRLRDEAHARH